MTPRLLFADKRGRIATHARLSATGMKAGIITPLHPCELIRLPRGSELFMLPDRAAAGFDTGGLRLAEAGRQGLAVAAFLPPGYTATYSAAYTEIGRPKILPLFAYAACASMRGELYAAAIRVDPERRHDGTRISIAAVRKGIVRIGRALPDNRLVAHLERCALGYGCCGAQNFFLRAYECPLPASPSCNAACAGCISAQQDDRLPPTQPRIEFIPRPDELAQIALHHLRYVRNAVVSFGQGCEGEPLMAGDTIEQAIRIIRSRTADGIINMNTNASKPEVIKRLLKAGLGSIRVSMNSAREKYYTRYYRPRGYAFPDVMRSIALAKKAGAFVSLNYLTMPGFTDTPEEFAALKTLIARYRIDMIQWRNLNYDPLRYFEWLKAKHPGPFIGIRRELDILRAEFPHLKHGYFNPMARRS